MSLTRTLSKVPIPDRRLEVSIPGTIFIPQRDSTLNTGDFIHFCGPEDFLNYQGFVLSIQDGRIKGFVLAYKNEDAPDREVCQTNLDFEITAEFVEGIDQVCHKDELREGSNYYFTHHYHFGTKTLSPLVRMDGRMKLELTCQFFGPSNQQYMFLVKMANEDIQNFLKLRVRNMHRSKSLTIKKFPFEYFALLAIDNGITTISHSRHLYKITIHDLQRHQVFGENCWHRTVKAGTIHVVGPVTISFSMNKPKCIRVAFRGCKLLGPDGQVQWNSTSPNSFKLAQASSTMSMFEDPLNFD